MTEPQKELFVEMHDLIDDIVSRVQDGARVTMAGCGQSMYPFIDENTDRIVLEKAHPDNIRVGEIYLYRRANGRYAIHRVYRVKKHTVSMLGDSQYFIERGVKKQDVLAIVTQIVKPDRTVDCTSNASVLQSALRMKYKIFRSVVRRWIRMPFRIVKKLFKKKDRP